VLKYHGLARRYLMPHRLLVRPLLNGGTLGRARLAAASYIEGRATGPEAFMTGQMLKVSVASRRRTVAAGVLGAAIAATLLVSAWLEPSLFSELFHGDTTNLGLAFLSLIPLVFAAALWVFRQAPPYVWWLAWALTSAMAALGLVLAIGLHAMGQSIKAEGLIP
jgi:hypothetical protein